MHLVVLINHSSGTRSKRQFLSEISAQCLKKAWSYEVHSSWYVNNPGHVERIAAEEDAVVVISGGDGTVNKVIRAFWEQKLLSRVNFLIHPGGTFNALVKNTNYKPRSLKKISRSIEQRHLIHSDLLEVLIEAKGKKRLELVHTGILFVKDCKFTRHAARIQKALHQFDFKLGVSSIKKALPYLDEIPAFRHKHSGKIEIFQGVYIANNPYLITNKVINSAVKIDDGNFQVFSLSGADFFKLGQIASVLLLGSQKKLPFLQIETARSYNFTALEDIDMNLDGDIEEVVEGTKINISISPQKIKLIKYL